MTNHPSKPAGQVETDGAWESPRARARARRTAWIGGISIVFVFMALSLAGYVENWLWMRQLEYVGIFWTLLSVQFAMGALALVVVFSFLFINLHEAVRGGPDASASPLRSILAPIGDSNAEAAATDAPAMRMEETLDVVATANAVRPSPNGFVKFADPLRNGGSPRVVSRPV